MWTGHMHEHELKSQIFHVCSTLRVGVTPEANTCADAVSHGLLRAQYNTNPEQVHGTSKAKTTINCERET
jgi:hypothetical protein